MGIEILGITYLEERGKGTCKYEARFETNRGTIDSYFLLNRPAFLVKENIRFERRDLWDKDSCKKRKEEIGWNLWEYFPVANNLFIEFVSRWNSEAKKAIMNYINRSYEVQREIWMRNGQSF